MRGTTLILLVTCALSLSNGLLVTPVYAQDIGSSVISPSSPLYFLKGVREELELKFTPNKDVMLLRHLEFGHRRLREVKSLISEKRYDLIPATLERYWFNMDKINHLEGFKHDLNRQIVNEISRHLSVLEQFYGQVEDERAKIFIRSSIYRLAIRNNELRHILGIDINETHVKACNFLAKEATSSAPIESGSALNEVDKAILYERAQKCFKY